MRRRGDTLVGIALGIVLGVVIVVVFVFAFSEDAVDPPALDERQTPSEQIERPAP